VVIADMASIFLVGIVFGFVSILYISNMMAKIMIPVIITNQSIKLRGAVANSLLNIGL